MRNAGKLRRTNFDLTVQTKDEILSTVVVYFRVGSCEIINKDEW